jgi:hypothetical protein
MQAKEQIAERHDQRSPKNSWLRQKVRSRARAKTERTNPAGNRSVRLLNRLA